VAELIKMVDTKIKDINFNGRDSKAFEKELKMGEIEFKTKVLKKMSEKTKK